MHRSTEFVHVLAGCHGCQWLAENPMAMGVLRRFIVPSSCTDFVPVAWPRLQNMYRKIRLSVQIPYQPDSESEATLRFLGRGLFAAKCATSSAAVACAKVLNCFHSFVALHALSSCLGMSNVGSSVKR